MARKSTYEELEQRVKELERKVYELMEAEGALRNKEEMVRALLTATTDSVFLTDLDGIIIASNKLAAQRFGKNMNEFTGKCVWDFLPLELAKTKKAHIDDLIRSGKPAYYEEERKAHFFYYSIYPVLDTRGKVERIAFFARDVTKRKQAEEVLRESEEKYRNILESIEDGYFEVDIAGNFTFFNDSLCKILTYSKDELMGMNNRQYTDEENVKKLYKTFNKVYTTGKPDKGFDWEIIRKDGGKRYVEASVSLRKDPEGQPTGFRGIVRDITERKQMQDELAKHRDHLEDKIRKRTAELQTIVNSMSGREVRMVELKKVIKKLRSQLEGAGMKPVADDPWKEVGKDYT